MITETDMVGIIKSVLNEGNRVMSGYSFRPFDWARFESMGVNPYVFNNESNYYVSLIEINKENIQKYVNKRIFLLYPEEYDNITKVIESHNNLIDKYNQKMALLQEMLPTILVERIMAD